MNEEYNKKLLGAIFRIHAAVHNMSHSLTERSGLLRNIKNVINGDLSRSHEMLTELDESLDMPTPQKSPWIKIEPGCRLPEKTGDVVLLEVYSHSSSYFKAAYYKESKLFERFGYTVLDLEEIYADKSCDRYYMLIPPPPLPGGEE